MRNDDIKQNDFGIKEPIFRKYIEFFGTVLILVILIIGYLLLINPKLRTNKEVTKELMELKIVMASKQAYLNKLRVILDSYNQINKYNKDFVNDFLPESLDLPSLITNINAIAVRNGMEVERLGYNVRQNSGLRNKNITEGGETVVGELEAVDVSVHVLGSGYNRFKNFIEDLENSSRLIELESFSFDPLSDGYDLNFTVYYYSS